MLKKTITYTDYEGNERTEDFYFNYSKAEVIEMELKRAGGFAKQLERIVQTIDSEKLVVEFKEFVLGAYGEKSADGKRFIKTQELRDAFSQTEAYSKIYLEFFTDKDAAPNFVNGVIPQDLDK